ncbi:hypothetical protein ACFV0Y_16590 [Streptomyces sp. NPDC059569]|uniref:hypothetical protein n=1 Tax=Streptomyces sp. NPDC059569 TaxID=3346869 RepID=UPI0036B23263
MPSLFIEKLRSCGDCRKLAVAYGLDLAASRRPGAEARDWGLRLTVAWLDLEYHLTDEHAEWLPGRYPECDTCESWRSDLAVGPIQEVEALHRAWHLCEPLRGVGADSIRDLCYLMG